MKKPQHEQDYEVAEDAIVGEHSRSSNERGLALAALTRLRSESAKVPGLEAHCLSLKESVDNLRTERAALLERLAKAESERDAERVTHTAFQDAVEASAGRLEAKVATIEAQCQEAFAQRDAAQREAHRLSNALALEQTTRDRVVGEANTLRERVATLEASVIEDRRAGNDFRVRWGEAEQKSIQAEARVKELEALGTAAHKAVSALNAMLATYLPDESRGWTFLRHRDAPECAHVVDEEADCDCGGTERGRLYDAVSAALVAYDAARSSQPPPAPAPMMESAEDDALYILNPDRVAGVPDALAARVARWALALDHARRTPTPPALVEAVKPLMPWVKALSRSAMEDDAQVSSVYPFAHLRVGQLRALRTSYDATRAAPVPVGLVDAVGPMAEALRDIVGTYSNKPDSFTEFRLDVYTFARLGWARRLLAAYDAAKGGQDDVTADLRRVLEMARTGSHVGDAATSLGEEAIQAVRALHAGVASVRTGDAVLELIARTEATEGDAAKYRAAVERLAHERTAGAEASHWDYAHVILTGDVPADASPVAPQETLDKARVVEVLRKWLPPTHAAFDDLGLTLDVGGGK